MIISETCSAVLLSCVIDDPWGTLSSSQDLVAALVAGDVETLSGILGNLVSQRPH